MEQRSISMKRAYAAFIIIGVIIAYSVSGIFIIKHENSRLISVLDTIQACCDNNDMKAAAENAGKLEKLWFGYEKRMSLIVKDEKLSELNTIVAKIRPYCEEANDELEAELQNIRHQLSLIYKSELPYWYNII